MRRHTDESGGSSPPGNDEAQARRSKDSRAVKDVKRTVPKSAASDDGKGKKRVVQEKKKRMPFGLETFEELEEVLSGFE